jgi:hypothetical protein
MQAGGGLQSPSPAVQDLAGADWARDSWRLPPPQLLRLPA